MVIREVEKRHFWVVIRVVKRGSFWWLLVWLKKKGQFGVVFSVVTNGQL